MIKSFKCKETEKIYNSFFSKKFPTEIQERAKMKLRMLNFSVSLNDLRIPPSNNLEQLKGDRDGQWSIRINKQWRICFNWINNDAFNVEVTDYH
ncbi:MAG TPA: type II toxin-antitoxin system RelE/ParE family toxin [Spirochaetota bacterium]|nr:type II toxin-antitoxin system RelE/ParE family toxin [Spirochaetota bacterium]